MTRKSLPIVFFIVLLVGACSNVALHQGLSEDDANEIMVLLHHYGIRADKVSEEKNQELSWSIKVAAADEAHARSLLVENQLPRKLSLGLSGVCKEEGLIPTPKREKCRELLAYKGEIINSLEKISGVVDADVVLNIPDPEEYLQEGKAPPHPTASVVVKTKLGAGGAIAFKEEQIQHFVANAIPNMDPGDVTVILTTTTFAWQSPSPVAPAGTPPVNMVMEEVLSGDDAGATDDASYSTIFGIKVHAESAEQFRNLGIVAMAVFLAISALLIVVLYLQIRAKRARKETLPMTLAAPHAHEPLVEMPGI